jgi:hypothetical protein
MTLLANPERLAHEAIAAALRPPAPIDYLDFAERNISFDDPIPGPFDQNKFPYFVEILRALSPSDPSVRDASQQRADRKNNTWRYLHPRRADHGARHRHVLPPNGR